MATYLDKIKEINNGSDMNKFLNNLHYGCLQAIAGDGASGRIMWKRVCLQQEHRGIDGCDKCKAEFWETDIETIDAMLLGCKMGAMEGIVNEKRD